MPATSERSGTSAAAIFGRLLNNSGKRLSPALARHILSLGFSDADKARVHELTTRNQEDALSAAEKEELMNYVKAADYLAILQSKARRALKQRKAS